jgi:ribosomal-protein-alanine N-acetyltransferase
MYIVGEYKLILKTERLLLRPLELDDVELIWSDITDPEISKYMAWEAHTDKLQTINFIKAEIERRKADEGITWVIMMNDEFCGIVSLIGLIRTHRALTYDKAELAYWLSRNFQGKGIMTEAANRVLEFGFNDLKLHKICVSHFSANEASEKLIKRLGFRFVGEQIEEYQKNGIWYNQKNYELIEKEYMNS